MPGLDPTDMDYLEVMMTDDRVTTTHTVVTFMFPFQLSGFDTPEAPGSFDVDIDSERIDGGNCVAHRHVATYIYLPNASGTRMVLVDPTDLAAALERDRSAQTNSASSS